jgi:hypothetical protein
MLRFTLLVLGSLLVASLAALPIQTGVPRADVQAAVQDPVPLPPWRGEYFNNPR